MTPEIYAAWSAALSITGTGAAAFGLWRAWEARGSTVPRRMVILLSGVTIIAGIGLHQALALWAWETGAWAGTASPAIATVGYRIAWTVGFLGFAGGASWDRCGHKGWLALAALGAIAAGVSVAV